MIFQYGVDTPWGDQWDATATRPLFEKMDAGTLGPADFFAFHNEHRILFPRLLSLAVGTLTYWNIRAELMVLWILACLCSVNLWRVAQETGWQDNRNGPWLLLGANLLLFSPLQWENLLWGFQIGFFLPLATMTACLWTARSLRRPFDFIAAMALCLISTFSIASGFASWFLTAPLLLLWNRKMPARSEKIWWSIWTATAVASVGLHFRGLSQPTGHPSPLLAFAHPLEAIQFTLTYLGTPFCTGTALDRLAVAQLSGGILLFLLLASVAYLWHWRRDRTLLPNSLPWVSLASIALVNAVLTTLGRLGLGTDAAIQSRYVSFAIMLPIGLLFLLTLVLRHRRERTPAALDPTRGRLIFVSLVTAFALLFLGAAIHSLQFWRFLQHERLTGKSALLFLHVLDEPQALARFVHPSHWRLKGWSETIDRLGYLHPPLLRSARVREIASDAKDEALGELDQFVRSSDGELTASGWAILTGRHRVADSVLLAYDNPEGDPIIFARVDVAYPRTDVSEGLSDNAYQRCGWLRSWKPEEIPADVRRISAWAFDADNCRAFLIGRASL